MFNKVTLISILTSLALLAGACVTNGGATLQSTSTDTSSHNQGQNCLQSGCHLTGSKAFTMGGTLYTSAAGTTVSTNSNEEVIVSSGGNEITRIPVDAKGNFYTNYSFTFPVDISLSNGNSMGNELADTDGGCNQNGCHDTGNRVF